MNCVFIIWSLFLWSELCPLHSLPDLYKMGVFVSGQQGNINRRSDHHEKI